MLLLSVVAVAVVVGAGAFGDGGVVDLRVGDGSIGRVGGVAVVAVDVIAVVVGCCCSCCCLLVAAPVIVVSCCLPLLSTLRRR